MKYSSKAVYFSFFFFFKQKTAYEMLSGDWSSDVCSSDLREASMKSALRMIAGHGGRDTGAIAGDKIERDLNIDAVLSFNDVMLREFVPHDVTIVVIGPQDPRDGNQTL